MFHGPVIVPYTLKTVSYRNIIFGIMNQYDPTHHLKINVGHYDLYFMVQWFYVIFWRLFDVWTSSFGDYVSVWPDVWPQMYVTLTYISWSTDFALYLKDRLVDECHIFR